jgi:hypothetical protein
LKQRDPPRIDKFGDNTAQNDYFMANKNAWKNGLKGLKGFPSKPEKDSLLTGKNMSHAQRYYNSTRKLANAYGPFGHTFAFATHFDSDNDSLNLMTKLFQVRRHRNLFFKNNESDYDQPQDESIDYFVPGIPCTILSDCLLKSQYLLFFNLVTRRFSSPSAHGNLEWKIWTMFDLAKQVMTVFFEFGYSASDAQFPTLHANIPLLQEFITDVFLKEKEPQTPSSFSMVAAIEVIGMLIGSSCTASRDKPSSYNFGYKQKIFQQRQYLGKGWPSEGGVSLNSELRFTCTKFGFDGSLMNDLRAVFSHFCTNQLNELAKEEIAKILKPRIEERVYKIGEKADLEKKQAEEAARLEVVEIEDEDEQSEAADAELKKVAAPDEVAATPQQLEKKVSQLDASDPQVAAQDARAGASNAQEATQVETRQSSEAMEVTSPQQMEEAPLVDASDSQEASQEGRRVTATPQQEEVSQLDASDLQEAALVPRAGGSNAQEATQVETRQSSEVMQAEVMVTDAAEVASLQQEEESSQSDASNSQEETQVPLRRSRRPHKQTDVFVPPEDAKKRPSPRKTPKPRKKSRTTVESPSVHIVRVVKKVKDKDEEGLIPGDKCHETSSDRSHANDEPSSLGSLDSQKNSLSLDDIRGSSSIEDILWGENEDSELLWSPATKFYRSYNAGNRVSPEQETSIIEIFSESLTLPGTLPHRTHVFENCTYGTDRLMEWTYNRSLRLFMCDFSRCKLLAETPPDYSMFVLKLFDIALKGSLAVVTSGMLEPNGGFADEFFTVGAVSPNVSCKVSYYTYDNDKMCLVERPETFFMEVSEYVAYMRQRSGQLGKDVVDNSTITVELWPAGHGTNNHINGFNRSDKITKEIGVDDFLFCFDIDMKMYNLNPCDTKSPLAAQMLNNQDLNSRVSVFTLSCTWFLHVSAFLTYFQSRQVFPQPEAGPLGYLAQANRASDGNGLIEPFTRFHSDDNGRSDAIHSCIRGTNEIVMFSRCSSEVLEKLNERLGNLSDEGAHRNVSSFLQTTPYPVTSLTLYPFHNHRNSLWNQIGPRPMN